MGVTVPLCTAIKRKRSRSNTQTRKEGTWEAVHGDIRDKIRSTGVAESRAGEDGGTRIPCVCDGSVLVPST